MNLQARASQRRDAKVNFDQIYVEDDPREYFRVLYGLDYIIPELAQPVFHALVRHLQRKRRRRVKVLDLGCSYGINAALLRYPLKVDRLAARYSDLQANGLDAEGVAELDRTYYQSWPKNLDIEIVGVDVSAPAIAYARNVGLIDAGFTVDLETSDMPADMAATLADVDLIISTGCIGYVGERTFAKLMSAIANPEVWVASFVLRMYPFTPIATVLERHGLGSEKLEGITFVQRRFHNEREFRDTLEVLRARGIPVEGSEEDGLLLAELFVSRPPNDRAAVPLNRLVTLTCGGERGFGRRFRRDGDDIVRLIRS